MGSTSWVNPACAEAAPAAEPTPAGPGLFAFFCEGAWDGDIVAAYTSMPVGIRLANSSVRTPKTVTRLGVRFLLWRNLFVSPVRCKPVNLSFLCAGTVGRMGA